jgi:hypothetical protein
MSRDVYKVSMLTVRECKSFIGSKRCPGTHSDLHQVVVLDRRQECTLCFVDDECHAV